VFPSIISPPHFVENKGVRKKVPFSPFHPVQQNDDRKPFCYTMCTMFNKGERKLSFLTLLCAIKATDSTLFSTELRATKATKSFAFLRTCVTVCNKCDMKLSFFTSCTTCQKFYRKLPFVERKLSFLDFNIFIYSIINSSPTKLKHTRNYFQKRKHIAGSSQVNDP
jgi:hypothetical protein